MSLIKIKAFSIDSTDSFTFGNANITTTLNGNIANFSGNITGSNANLGNLVVANYFSGNGSLLTSITGANVSGNVSFAVQSHYANIANSVSGTNVSGQVGNALIAGTVYTNAQPNITSVGTLTGLTVNGDITSTGNLIVAGTTTYINSTVTSVKDPIIEQGSDANNATLTSDDGMDRGSLLHYYTGGATRDAFMGWKNSSGEFTFASNVSTLNNVITVNNLGKIKAGDANLGNVVTSNYFVGNGSLLTSITGTNVTGNVSFAVQSHYANIANSVSGTNVSGNVNYAITSNWANIANSVSGTNVSGNVTSAVQSHYANIANSVSGTNVSGQVGNALVAGTVYTNAQPNITSVGTLTSVTVSGTTNLGAIGNVTITGGTSGQYLKTDGSGALSWATVALSGGNANISGSDTQLFFNDGGSNTLGTSSSLTFTKSTNTLTTANLVVSTTANLGAVANVKITGGSSGYLLKTDGSGSLSWYNPTYTTVGADDFTGNGVQTAFTLSSTPTNANYTIVSVGGVVQPKTTYTVSGATLTFSSAPPSTAPIEVTTINTGMSGGGGGAAWTYSAISANTTAVAGYRYIVDTSSANITVTLPASGTLGDEVMIIDGTGNANTHEITVGRNGGNIQGGASNMTVSTDRAAFTLVYYNATQGWILTNV